MDLRHPTVGPEIRERIVGCLVRLGASKEDAEDAVQDALVALVQRPSSAPNLASPESWVLTVARRRLMDRRRHDRRCTTVGHAYPETGSSPSPLLSPGLSVVSSAGAQLSDRLRRTLELLAEGGDARFISDQLGISRWAAYKRIQRVRAHLRTHHTAEPLDPG